MSRSMSLISLLVFAACGSDSSQPSSQERSASVVEAATHVSTISKYFVGAATTAQVAAAITADMNASGCVNVTAGINTVQATFDGCVSVSGNFTLDGTIAATISGQLLGGATIDLNTTDLVTADLDITGSWQVDVAAGLSGSAIWTGSLDIVGAISGDVQAQLTVDLGISGLCLDLSIDANATFDGSASVNANNANASADASLAISVSGLLSCGGCPTAGEVQISVDGAAAGGWTYGGGSVTGSGSVSGSVSIGFGGGFDCPAQTPQE